MHWGWAGDLVVVEESATTDTPPWPPSTGMWTTWGEAADRDYHQLAAIGTGGGMDLKPGFRTANP
jgi:hypothetical protein